MKKKIYIFFTLACLLTACKTSKITVAGYKEAVIYVNGVYKGIGAAYISRIVTARSIQIRAEFNGRRVGTLSLNEYWETGQDKYPLHIVVPIVPDTQVAAPVKPPPKNVVPGDLRPPVQAADTAHRAVALLSNEKAAPKTVLKPAAEEPVAFDSRNKVFLLSRELESRVKLFPRVKDFKSARIVRTSKDSMYLHIEAHPKNLRMVITGAGLRHIRTKVDTHVAN